MKMTNRILWSAVVVLLAATVSCDRGSAPDKTTAVVGVDPAQVDAFIDAYPAIESYKSMKGYLAQKGTSFNSFLHYPGVGTHETRWVVRPNNDTVYSIAWINLSGGPVKVELPETDLTERYIALMAIDFDHYQIDTYVKPTRPFVFVTKGQDPGDVGNAQVIRVETPLVFCGVRVEALSGKRDGDIVRALQQKMSIVPYGDGKLSEPKVPTFPSAVVAAGMEKIKAATKIYDFPDAFFRRDNAGPPIARAVGVYLGQWGQQVKYAYSGFVDTDGSGKPLSAKHDYVMEVLAPGMPIDRPGFWSLTVYNEDGYMIAPDSGETPKYKHGDKNTKANGDGSLTLRFFSDCSGKGNCVETGDGLWNVTMRLYGPKPNVLSGDWTLPPLKKIR